jgi:N-acyl-D-aspartate/D-glutamate deacylase
MPRRSWLLVLTVFAAAAACTKPTEYDLVLRNGTIYDGSGQPPRVGDVAVNGDRIAKVGDLGPSHGSEELDVSGLAVAPGFVNMMSGPEELIADGRSQSDIRQGVTLEIFGEGESGGPLNEEMKQNLVAHQADIKYAVEWTTLGESLDYLERRGISPNVASFLGATTARVHELGYADRAPTPEELDRMRALVRQAMEEGALGVASALIYAPGFYAKTDELVELARVASGYGGMYISHMRSEGNQLLEAVDELLTIAREAHIRAEIYHLKAGGQSNWPKMEQVIEKVEAARKEGLEITADMYTYTAGSTGLDAAMPPWVQEGGYDRWVERLRDPAIRKKVLEEMRTPTNDWENLLLAAGAEGTLLVGLKNEALKPVAGKTLAEVATERGKSPEETAIDLVVEDGTRVQVVYFLMSEDNITRQIALPWVSFCSDAGSMAPEGVFLKSSTHPRAYGNFARLLGKYVRDEKVIPLEEAVRKLAALPAKNLRLEGRGLLAPDYFADIVVFDPAKIRDVATYEKPQQYAIGMVHVFINGTQVLKDGEHTGATPGRVLRGPGWTRKAETEAR